MALFKFNAIVYLLSGSVATYHGIQDTSKFLSFANSKLRWRKAFFYKRAKGMKTGLYCGYALPGDKTIR